MLSSFSSKPSKLFGVKPTSHNIFGHETLALEIRHAIVLSNLPILFNFIFIQNKVFCTLKETILLKLQSYFCSLTHFQVIWMLTVLRSFIKANPKPFPVRHITHFFFLHNSKCLQLVSWFSF